jgi:hypothetical protein
MASEGRVMSRYITVLVLLGTLHFGGIVSLANSPVVNHELTLKLKTPVRQYTLKASSFLEALMQVADQFRIPMGIAWVDTPPARTRVSLSLKSTTVEEIIEAIAKSQPGYSVQVSDGVVHIFSTQVPASQNFLLLKVDKFEARHEVVQMAQRRLRELVQDSVAPPMPTRGGIAGSLITNVGEPKISVDVNDAKVYQVLDSLAIASPKKVWVVTFTDSLTGTGFRRTSSLWTAGAIPDSEQPVWNMFSWHESIPPGAYNR